MQNYASLLSLAAGLIILLGAGFRVALVLRRWRLSYLLRTRQLRPRSFDGERENAHLAEKIQQEDANLVALTAPLANVGIGITEAIVGAAFIFGSIGLPGFQFIGFTPKGVSPETILPSRIFAGPGQYPPRQFKAYGIVAFNTRPTSADKARYDMICDAYVSGLLHYTSVKAPIQQQMVTVWPIENADLATRINAEAREKVCADAVPHYGLAIAQEAIKAAKKNMAKLDDQGPFLLAWSPGAAKGQSDALVLVSDMSDVINNEQAKQIFTRWALDIQENPELWSTGWDQEKLKLVIRLWVDKWGEKILQAINMKS